MRKRVQIIPIFLILVLFLFIAGKQFVADFYYSMACKDGRDPNKAIRYLENCILIDEKNSSFHFTLGREFLRKGLAKAAKKNEKSRWLRESIYEFRKAIDLRPSSSEYHFHLGISYGYLAYPPNFYWKVIQNSFTRTAMLNPTNIRHLSSMKEYYLNKYNRIKSIGMNSEEIGSVNYKKYEALLKENYQFYFQLNLIRNLLEAGRLDEAINEYHKILEKNPNLSKSMYDKIRHYQGKGHYLKAVDILNEALLLALNR